MRPVSAVYDGISLEINARCLIHIYRVRASVVFFSLGIINVASVDIRTLFSDYRDVFRLDDLDNSAIPITEWTNAARHLDGGRIGRLNERLESVLSVAVIVRKNTAAAKDRSAFKIESRI